MARFEGRQNEGHMVVGHDAGVSSAPFAACRVPATRAHLSKDSLRIDMEIQFPKKEKKKAKAWSAAKRNTGSMLSHIFTEQKYPEPVYFQSVDCVGIPHFLSPKECRKIIDFAEAQGFSRQNRHRVLNMMWSDLIDPFLVEALWQVCGLGWFLRKLTIDGEVPCGLNDVVRIQKFGPGGVFGKHTDQPVRRADGRNSKYSLRIFLNGKDEAFEGGLSAFHVAFRPKPVVFEPEAGLALIYPQGEFCQVQEELEVWTDATPFRDGYKYSDLVEKLLNKEPEGDLGKGRNPAWRKEKKMTAISWLRPLCNRRVEGPVL
ncbi:unnamed protein product [Durusdinium trenchii]|uniref:Fe2OG dioxygenase domain-containing protein n=1 Tax=Durusdinium trenchii TaxID=1381693 RepID=A0ABP0NYN7_9DINO